jgi:hypothetical protein
MSTPFETRQRRRYIVLGVGAVIAGVALTPEALESIRTGIPIHTLHGPDTEGWLALAAVVFCIFLGLAAIGAGLGYIRLRNAPPPR